MNAHTNYFVFVSPLPPHRKGSPLHPSWPAMHAAGSTCSYWLPAIAKISPEQYCEALRLDYAVAFARTVAGTCSVDNERSVL
jgi:hypothetical protein